MEYTDIFYYKSYISSNFRYIWWLICWPPTSLYTVNKWTHLRKLFQFFSSILYWESAMTLLSFSLKVLLFFIAKRSRFLTWRWKVLGDSSLRAGFIIWVSVLWRKLYFGCTKKLHKNKDIHVYNLRWFMSCEVSIFKPRWNQSITLTVTCLKMNYDVQCISKKKS